MSNNLIFVFTLVITLASCGSEQDDSINSEKEPDIVKSKDNQITTESSEEYIGSTGIDSTDLEALFEISETDQPWQKSKTSLIDSFFILNISGKEVTFPCNRDLESEPRSYTNIGEHHSLELYFVELNQWERSQIHLIDRLSGIKDTLWTEPIFSPNNIFLISKIA